MSNDFDHEKAITILIEYNAYRKLQNEVEYNSMPLNTEMNIYITKQLNKLNKEYKKLTGKDI